jgi:hypothetical protein
MSTGTSCFREVIQTGARETERLVLLHAQELAFPEVTPALGTR